MQSIKKSLSPLVLITTLWKVSHISVIQASTEGEGVVLTKDPPSLWEFVPHGLRSKFACEEAEVLSWREMREREIREKQDRGRDTFGKTGGDEKRGDEHRYIPFRMPKTDLRSDADGIVGKIYSSTSANSEWNCGNHANCNDNGSNGNSSGDAQPYDADRNADRSHSAGGNVTNSNMDGLVLTGKTHKGRNKD
jgi:hypothetical protein